MNVWIEAARPKTLIASLSPVVIGSIIAGTFSWVIFFFALILQVGTNYANDYFDFVKGTDTEKRKGPRRAMAAGLVNKKAMIQAITLCFSIVAILSLYLIWWGGWLLALLSGLAIVLGVFYTASNYSLSSLGLGDVVVFLFFGPIAVAGIVYLHSGSISPLALLAGIAPGALSTAILAVNNVRDIEEDRAAGRKTIPVRFGKRIGELEYPFLLFVTMISTLLVMKQAHCHYFLILASITPLLGAPHYATLKNNPEMHNTVLAKTGLLLFIYTLTFAIGWWL